jgi:hypothetical protein
MVLASAMVCFVNIAASSAARFKPSLGGSLAVRKMEALDHILKRFCRGASVKCIKKTCLSNYRSLFIAYMLCWGLYGVVD